jgi:hypothetical protein
MAQAPSGLGPFCFSSPNCGRIIRMSRTTLCRTFLCKSCQWPMTIPCDMLLRAAANPADQPSAAREAVLRCYWCTALRTYSLDSNSPDRYGDDRRLPCYRCDNVMRLLVQPGLRCEEWETCNSRPLLLDTFPAYLCEDFDCREANAKKGWITEGLTCRNGHLIRFPQP